MNRREILIIVLVTILIIVTFALVALFSSGSSPIKEKSTQKRFSAAPGKTREQPLLLVSKKREDTFGAEEKKGQETAQINKVYSAELGKEGRKNNDKEKMESNTEENREERKSVEAEIPDSLRQLLQSPNDMTQKPKEEIEENLNNWINSVQSQEKKLEVLKNNLDLLITKGLTDWLEKRLEEIINQGSESKMVLSESQWLLGQVKIVQGDTAKAEEYIRQAWQNISDTQDVNDLKQEELMRLIGLNYVQILREQNKGAEAENVIKIVSEKLKR